MKVLYKNKVGKLVSLETSIYCDNCIYHPNHISISQCKKVGLMKLCVGVLNYYTFELSSSDILQL